MYEVLVEVVGDKDISTLTRANGLACRDSLLRLPAIFRKKKQIQRYYCEAGPDYGV